MTTVLIRQGRVIDPSQNFDERADLLIVDGKIEAVSTTPIASIGAHVEVIEAQGKWVMPGFIDLHVHLREPGDEHKETILTGSQAAVAGGFTSVVAMPNTRVVNDSAVVTHFVKMRASEANLCRVYVAGAITKGLKGEELSEIGSLVEAGCVCITDDGRPVMNSGLMRRALEYSKSFDIPVMVHEEDLNLSGRGSMNEGPTAIRLGLLPIPSSAEVTMVARDLVLAEETQARLHIAHVSCEGSVRLIREARRRGIRVTAEATPHHFVLTDEAVDGYDTHAKMNPPLRAKADINAIAEGLADGTIDAIATDHAPHGVGDKRVEFDQAANGIIGLETALPLSLELVRRKVLTPLKLAARLSTGPARAFGLKGGALVKGALADVTVVDPEIAWKVDAKAFYSKSRNTPFDGRQVNGKVTHTLVGGRVVFNGPGHMGGEKDDEA